MSHTAVFGCVRRGFGEDQELRLRSANCPVGHGERESGLQIKVPAGVDTGSRLRFGGKEKAGIGDGERGDLYVVIRVSDHESFIYRH